MRQGCGSAELDLAQDERERHDDERDQGQDPEYVHISEVARLRLHLLADPGEGLLLGLRKRAAMRREVIHQLLQRALILAGRWVRELDQPALMKLLLRATLISAEAMSVLPGAIPS